MASTSTTLCLSHGGAATSPFIFSDEEHIPSPPPPPPTPCNHPPSAGESDAFLSHLLARLSLPPPTLAPRLPLPTKQKALAPPTISLNEPNRQLFLWAATKDGFFHLSDHGIPSHLHETFLQKYRSNQVNSNEPDLSTGDSEDGKHVHMFETDGGDEYATELKRVGSKVLELLFEERGFGTEARCLMCVSPNTMKENSMEKGEKEPLYSYIVGLTYEGRGRKSPREAVEDSGEWVPVGAREETVLVTIGETGQVWSNGRFKKVRSLPQPSSPPLHQNKEPDNVLVTLLFTLAEERTVTSVMPPVHDENICS